MSAVNSTTVAGHAGGRRHATAPCAAEPAAACPRERRRRPHRRQARPPVSPRVTVVGHVEWVDFVPVEKLPGPGSLIHSEGAFACPAGGGGVACGVLAELGAD